MRIDRELWRTAYIQVAEKGSHNWWSHRRGRKGCIPQHPELLKDSKGRERLRRKIMKVVIEDCMALNC